MSLDINTNRKDQKYSIWELFLRVFWGLGRLIFCLTPRPFFGCRRFILRIFGAKIGKHVHIYPSTTIYFPWNLTIGDWSAIGENALIYNLGPIIIGKKSTISHNAHLCAGTHDYNDPTLPLLKPKIIIDDEVWVAAEAFIGPSVHINEGAVIGARSCVVKDVNAWSVVAGNPAKHIKKRIIRDE
ncbi:hypothetical protein [Sunxiuqinia elliptica]|uniref:Putative colanic acid biosynthesis acetyltransferase WcaF n=1 Tax=Sunxiuqinia elliptica TaxID=655355 RepID=A0A4R6GU63_9BACT|nr:hypothetical protein [Sunxiuqinia elliptica]TDN98224.1 putative colanic acid biosynthesis acetyltransferase WcaF [Sunxiuqinia elliptica]TDO60331.1 putative colanic acid biosynthesis acetyltransferase WcaF [Sunxiuqinia elliptica]